MERKTQSKFLIKREGVWHLWPGENRGQPWHKQESMAARYLELVIKAVITDELSETEGKVRQASGTRGRILKGGQE